VTTTLRSLIREALGRLGVVRLLLGIHDAAFPSRPGEDVGCGTPNGDGATDLLDLAAQLGFDGLQLGPQGAVTPGNPSPYDGTFFSRNPLSTGLADLTREEWGSLLPPGRLAEEVRAIRAGEGTDHARAYRAVEGMLDEVARRYRDRAARGEGGAIARIGAGLERFRAENADWLESDATFASSGIESYALVQYVLATQHREFRARARARGLEIFGDLQVGMSERDAWRAREFLLDGWRMGAPPSRTNPAGQAWNYPVLDPRQYRDPGGAEGRALGFFRARVRRAFDDYDGLRIDHPHGLVCPWVYPVDADPGRAARERGARLFESPDLPELAEFAIARIEQIDPSVPRHADDRVRWLDDAQVERQSILIDVLMEEAGRCGRGAADIVAEILSTQPLPLRLVAERHGLGRLRVTQKADIAAPDDVYRGENASRQDWIQMSTHDTPTIWGVAARWLASGEARERARYLAGRVLEPGIPRDGWVARAGADREALVRAQCADLFVGPATHVSIYFTDLFGSERPYNEPGTVSPSNWSQRVPRDPVATYQARRRAGRALDVQGAIAASLRARGADTDGLAGALERHPGPGA
jgi:4-alpha-glucanotransferase